MVVIRYKQPETADAARPADPDILAGAVRRLLHQTDRGSCPGSGDRRRSGSWPAHRNRRTVGARTARQDGFRPLPWRAQPRPLVRAVDGPRPAALAVFVPDGPVVVGIDETIERRWGPKISARGIYRDPVRSSHGHFVKASGLRWISVMLLVHIPWAGRIWGLPFLTTLAPSERFARRAGRRHKPLADWGRQLLLLARRWLPGRRLIAVADTTYAVIELLAAVRHRLTMVTRLRLDARLFDPPPPHRPGARGRRRVTGQRQPTLVQRLTDPASHWRRVMVSQWYGEGRRELDILTGTAVWDHPGRRVPVRWVLVRDVGGEHDPQAFVCTDQGADALDVLRWFVRRWAVEVTFEEVRRHLGVETQRQWSDNAIARTTPALLALFSLVTLWAHDLVRHGHLGPRCAAWY